MSEFSENAIHLGSNCSEDNLPFTQQWIYQEAISMVHSKISIRMSSHLIGVFGLNTFRLWLQEIHIFVEF